MDLRALLHHPLAPRVLSALAIVGVLVLLRHLAARLVTATVAEPDTRYRVRKGLALLTWLAAALAVAATFDEFLGNVAVVIGFAAAGTALALQEVLTSIAGWVANGLGHYYRVGDRVQLGRTRGDVIDVTVLRTTLLEIGEWVAGDQYTGRIVRVANSAVVREPVFNYSADFEFLWDEVRVPVHATSDAALARTIFGRVLEETVGAYGRSAEESWRALAAKYRVEPVPTAPTVFLVVTDNWLEFTLRYVVDYRQRRATKDALFRRLLEEVAASGGRVAIASQTLELVPMPGAPETHARAAG